MALIKTVLKSGIKQLLTDMQTRDSDAMDEFADRLAGLIDTYVKSATITVNGVVTVGSAATQTQSIPVVATIN